MCPGIRVPTGGNSISKDERVWGNTDQGTQMASVAERLGVSIREVTEGHAELPMRPVTLCTAPRRPLSLKFPVIVYRPGPSEAQLSLLFSSQQKYSKAKKKKSPFWKAGRLSRPGHREPSPRPSEGRSSAGCLRRRPELSPDRQQRARSGSGRHVSPSPCARARKPGTHPALSKHTCALPHAAA